MSQQMSQQPKKSPKTIYNFSAGPAMLPPTVMQAVRDEWLDWQNLGVSVVEVSHRSPEYAALMTQAEADLRVLLSIPDTYHVLWLGGAARMQFASIPLNFLAHGQQAGYWVTGTWSELALAEAQHLKKAYCIANAQDSGCAQIPPQSEWRFEDNTAYVYYTSNETVHGVRFAEVPKPTKNIPLIADMSSDILSEPFNINDFGLVFAGSQKNIAPPGLTIVIVHQDLLNTALDGPIPTMLDYRIQAAHQSLYATPPTFSCYMAAKMFSWIKAEGGVGVLQQRNHAKAQCLYDLIDASSLYHCPVEKPYRSWMNVRFNLRKPELEPLFLEQAARAGLRALKGHKQVGGVRASLYNAMPMEGVEALTNFMCDFARLQS